MTTVNEYEIAARYQPIVEAAGMYDTALRPGNIFMLASAIMTDAVVRARAEMLRVDPTYPAMAQPDYVTALRRMTLRERALLAQRIRERWAKGKA